MKRLIILGLCLFLGAAAQTGSAAPAFLVGASGTVLPAASMRFGVPGHTTSVGAHLSGGADLFFEVLPLPYLSLGADTSYTRWVFSRWHWKWHEVAITPHVKGIYPIPGIGLDVYLKAALGYATFFDNAIRNDALAWRAALGVSYPFRSLNFAPFAELGYEGAAFSDHHVKCNPNAFVLNIGLAYRF